MGLFKRSGGEVVSQNPNALTASAARVTTAKLKGTIAGRLATDKWQDEAWRYYDCIGEYRSVAQWTGNVLSKARLFATYDDGTGPKRVPETHIASKYVQALFGGADGQARMLEELGINHTVVGESYLLGWEEDGQDVWAVATASSLKQTSDGSFTYDGKPLPTDSFIIRIWQPHPKRPSKANSPSRPALPILAQIERLMQRTAAQLDSAIASAGIMLLPSSVTFQGDKKGAEEVLDLLIETMAEALANPGEASSITPIVLTADKEDIAAARHLTFSTPLDKESRAMMKEAQHRLALTMDIPPEVMSGMGESNHWAAWAIDESSIKSHTEPLLKRIVTDLTTGYLHSLLQQEAAHKEDYAQYGIGVDTSEMRLRPNRSKEALELYDRFELSGEALRRETGFDEDDAPDDEEIKARLILKTATGSTTPEIVAQALNSLGLGFTVTVPDTDTQEERPTPSLEEHPTDELPDTEAAALLAAAEQMVWRALERAGNRLKTRIGKTSANVDACNLYRLYPMDRDLAATILTDAWTKVPMFAQSHNVDPRSLVAALDAYTTAILVEQAAFDTRKLKDYLTQFVVKRKEEN